MDTPRYVFGAQGFGVAWTDDNVDHLMKSLKEAGIRQFDTAALYPATNPGLSEELLGTKKPDDALIDTKILFIGDDSLSFKNMGASIKASLERLQVKKVSEPRIIPIKNAKWLFNIDPYPLRSCPGPQDSHSSAGCTLRPLLS
jgi:hypothetical protein